MFNENDIRETAQAFQKSRVLLTAYELDIFTAIGEDIKSSSEVAKFIGANERSTDRLMNALAALSLLKKRCGKFSNTAASRRFLVKGEPEFMAGLMHSVHLWDSWSGLTQAVRLGHSTTVSRINKRGQRWLTAFIAAMHERASRQATNVVKMLDLGGVSYVLDIGAGSGAYSMAFVRAKKGIKSTAFDLPNVIPIAKKYISEAGLSNKIETVSGDYNTKELGNGFDLVFLSAIIHSNSFEENINLIWKCSKALKPGGRIVIQDFIMDEDRSGPSFGTLFALNMLVATEAGDTYTESEVRLWLKEANLQGITRKDTAFGTTLIIGRKPG